MADVGSVRYEVELDDSKLEQQATKTEKTITSKLGGVVGKVGKGVAAGVGLAAGGVALVGTTAVKLAGEVSKAGDEIDKMSQKIGISTTAYQEWGYVFERSGADVNNLQTGMKTLSSVIADAANGSESAASKLSAIGVSLEEINGLSQEDQLALVISRLQEMGEGAERTAAASDLLGRSATDMAAVLNMTAEDTQALIDEAHEYGMVMSEDAVASSAAYQDSLTKLQGTLGGLKNTLVSSFLPSLTQVVDGLSDVANGSVSMEDAIDQGINGMITALDESLPTMLERGAEMISSIVTGIANNLPKMLESAGSLVEKLATGLADNLPTILDAAGKLVIGLVEGIIAALPHLLNAAVEILGALAMYLLEKISTLLDAGAELIRQLKDKFTSIDWAQVGSDIIDGIKNGILSAAGRIADAAREAASAALNGAKKFLGISSPSKVFREDVGEMIPAGMAEGIEDGEDLVARSMDRMIQGFTADVAYDLPKLDDYAADLGASVTASSATEITVPLIVDGREMARAIAWYTNEQLAWEAR